MNQKNQSDVEDEIVTTLVEFVIGLGMLGFGSWTLVSHPVGPNQSFINVLAGVGLSAASLVAWFVLTLQLGIGFVLVISEIDSFRDVRRIRQNRQVTLIDMYS